MIRRQTRIGILVLAALVAGTYWAGRGQKDTAQPPIAGLDTRLDYALQEFELKYFDADGQPAGVLVAPALENDSISGISEVSKPAFQVIHRGNIWNIVAESASVAADREHIVLRGNVWMRRAGFDGSLPLNINTSELNLEVTPRIASSERPVRVIDGNDTMEAVGFRVNMTDNRFQLLNQAKLTYAVN